MIDFNKLAFSELAKKGNESFFMALMHKETITLLKYILLIVIYKSKVKSFVRQLENKAIHTYYICI